MIVGDRITKRMDALGISQGELARRVGIKQPSIYALININKHGSVHIHKIARELETTAEYLMGETDDPESNMPIPDNTSEEREFIELLRGLCPEDKRAVLQLTRSLAQRGKSPAPEPIKPPTVHDDALAFKSERPS